MTDVNQNGNSSGLEFDEAMTERYLFGELTEAEQEQFETAFFADDVFFERFLAVKNELLDLYARGELAPDKRARMEPHFFTTAPRRKRIEESRDFIRNLTAVSNRSAKRPAHVTDTTPSPADVAGWLDSVARFFTMPRLAAAAIIFLAAISGVWLFFRPTENTDRAVQPPPANLGQSNSSQDVATKQDDSNVNPTPETETNRPGPNIPTAQELADNAEATPTPPVRFADPTPQAPTMAKSDPTTIDPSALVPLPTPKPEVVAANQTESITLDGSTRSATKRNTANISAGTRSIAMRLLFGGEPYSSYSIRVSSVTGAAVWQARNLKAPTTDGAKSLTITVPANLLTRNDYIVVLDGRTADGKTETVREYYFHVDRPGSK